MVLVDFWTYSCVNWLRTLPYVSAWDERYRDRGLVVVGVHAPEFGFEHDLDNVRRAVARAGRRLPGRHRQRLRHLAVVREPVLAGASTSSIGDGRVRFRHFGEGSYEEIERAIQELLGVDEATVRVDAGGLAEAADWDTLGSPETYVGYARGERRADARRRLALNQWALAGEWSVGEESAVLDAAPGSIAYRFQARDLNLVLAPPARAPRSASRCASTASRPATPTASTSTPSARASSTSRGCTSSSASPAAVAERSFEITFLDPGVRAYVFTFG